MTNYKALFLDIDGTILRPDHTIEDSTIEAIKQVKQQGITVFIATGRPLHEINEIKDKLEIESCIGYNGAFATYQGKEVYNQPMKGELVQHFVETAAKHGEELVLYRSDANLFTHLEKPYVKEFIDYFDLVHNKLYQTKDQDNILGITAINVAKEHLSEYQAEDIFLSKVNVDGLRDSYDVIQKTTNKGEAVQFILNALNLKPDQAIAFGDGLNDRELLSSVEHSFAMGNASPELLPYAKYKTTSVFDNGIFNGLKRLGLVK